METHGCYCLCCLTYGYKGHHSGVLGSCCREFQEPLKGVSKGFVGVPMGLRGYYDNYGIGGQESFMEESIENFQWVSRNFKRFSEAFKGV